MQWKAQVRATVVERKDLTAIVYDEQWTASATNDDHARSLQLLQRGHANEVIGVLGTAELRHERHNRVLSIISRYWEQRVPLLG
jgi:hypothetical protein